MFASLRSESQRIDKEEKRGPTYIQPPSRNSARAVPTSIVDELYRYDQPITVLGNIPLSPLSLRIVMERLLAEEKLAISEVEKSLRELESIEENYQQLVERLGSLPNKIRHPATVPINSVGFFRGELIHTNEITVLLSTDYLVEVSASKASEIALRRIDECQKRKVQAKKQMKNLTEWRNITKMSIEESSKAVDINEEYNEAAESQWREEHARRVRQERRQERDSARKDPSGDRKWLERLEELEMLEELDECTMTDARPRSSTEALIPAVNSLKLDEPGTSSGTSREPRELASSSTAASSLQWNPSTGCFDSRKSSEQTRVEKKTTVVVDSDDSEEPETESDDAADGEAFTGLIVERDTSGNIVTASGGAPARQSRFKSSKR